MIEGQAKTYSFKSVGEKVEKLNAIDALAQKTTPIGIVTPISFGGINESTFKMHTTLLPLIKDNLRNLLRTNRGERLVHHDFGANLIELAFELGTEAGDTLAIERIAGVVSKYMPYIELDTFEPMIENMDNQHIAKVGVRVFYNVPVLGISGQGIEVIIYTAG